MAIPKECKRLAEVDFPIAVVSKHSAREKSIRNGHPSTLHLWWARRPLAACRAMLMALLLPDPCDPACPPEFRTAATDQLRALVEYFVTTKQGAGDLVADLHCDLKSANPQKKRAARKEADRRFLEWRTLNRTKAWNQEILRHALLAFIGWGAGWVQSSLPAFIDNARALVKAAHPEDTPLVVDPFAGGGSIPLEALRLGCEAFASDLNPVACLILKVMLEDIPRHGPGLADELRRVGKEIKEAAEKELSEFYPKDPDGATPIAYLWARTVRCESPNCGAEIPLMRSFWLCKKANRNRALRPKVVQQKNDPPRVEFEIFQPKTDKEVHEGTVLRAKASCLCCGSVLTPERLRAKLSEQRGGADAIFDDRGSRIGGARMLTVVTTKPGEQGRHYRLPVAGDYQAVYKAQQHLKQMLEDWAQGGSQGLCPVPDEPISTTELRRISIPLYGCASWRDAFCARQQIVLSLLTQTIKNQLDSVVSAAVALTISRMTNAHTAFSRWHTARENIEGIFSRQAVGMVWDFCEGNPVSEATGSVAGGIAWVAQVAEQWPGSSAIAQVARSDAAASVLPDESASVWFTDPPYYDAVPYAHLADLFYVWLRRAVGNRFPELFVENLTPKNEECVADRPHKANPDAKSNAFYEAKMSRAMEAGRRVLNHSGIGCIVFAHKSTEGWEALLSGILTAGWTVTASWPITTEMATRNTARDTASLAASVHLVCRPRPEDAPIGDWGEVFRELPKRVGSWMERLQIEGVRGADLVFACIGPALEIFSRYCRVEDAAGNVIPLGGDPEASEPYKRGFLAYVWETVGRIALEQVLGTEEAQARNGMAGSLEEDARLTALFLWTIQATNGQNGAVTPAGQDEDTGDEDDEKFVPKGKAKGYSLIFDVARRFSQPLGIELPKWEGRIIETTKGVVRLLAVSERAKQIFGTAGADSAVEELISTATSGQMYLPGFGELAAKRVVKRRGRGQKFSVADPADIDASATTLDRVHAAMLLQAGGQAHALRTLIAAEQDRSPDFLRLANALSALYPTGSEEKRLLDAMLLAVPR